MFGTVTYDSQGYKKQIRLYTYEEKGIQYDKNRFEEGEGVLEYMRKTLYENSLFFGTGRDAGRIQGVLSELEKVWKQYPDMRLGQLLVNVCGDKDLFAIEDENLLACAHCVFVDFQDFLVFIYKIIKGTFFETAFIHKFLGSNFTIIPGCV